MWWERADDRFFDDLSKAFNTPTSQTLILPKINNKNAPGPKRQKNLIGNTGVGIRPTIGGKSKQRKGLKSRSFGKSMNDKKTKKLGNLLTGMVLYFIPNSRK